MAHRRDAGASPSTEKDVPIRLGRACHSLDVESLGRRVDEDGERELYVASLPSLGDWRRLASDSGWAAAVEEPLGGFALFVACDASKLSVELIGSSPPTASSRDSFGSAPGAPTASGFTTPSIASTSPRRINRES